MSSLIFLNPKNSYAQFGGTREKKKITKGRRRTKQLGPISGIENMMTSSVVVLAFPPLSPVPSSRLCGEPAINSSMRPRKMARRLSREEGKHDESCSGAGSCLVGVEFPCCIRPATTSPKFLEMENKIVKNEGKGQVQGTGKPPVSPPRKERGKTKNHGLAKNQVHCAEPIAPPRIAFKPLKKDLTYFS